MTFNVTATGSPPPLYQWRRNGVNIPGATGPTLPLLDLQPADSGVYSVLPANVSGTVASQPATLVVDCPPLLLANDFAQRTRLSAPVGVGTGTNIGATREAGEPLHANQRGGSSVWTSWMAPQSGIATFSSRGSDFDTLLAVYTGGSLSSLIPLASDDDRGGFSTSQVSFNAQAGQEYLIAVDGRGGVSGRIVLGWNLEVTDLQIPRFLTHPASQSALVGAEVNLRIVAASAAPPEMQWYCDCEAISGATNASLTLPSVTAANVGLYTVQARLENRSVESDAGVLELGSEAQVVSVDKFEDVLTDGTPPIALQHPGAIHRSGFVSVTAGVIGNQTLSNFGATSEFGEPNHAGVVGGASRWFRLRPETKGRMVLDTIGSDVDTVVAVYVGSSLRNLQLVASDNDAAPDHVRSLVEFDVLAGVDYLVVVDSVNAAPGTIRLNWRLEAPPGGEGGTTLQLIDWQMLEGGLFGARLKGEPSLFYVIEATTNFMKWLPILTNQLPAAPALFSDPASPDRPYRFYRARQRP